MEDTEDALRENTEAVRANTEALRQVTAGSDREAQRVDRRKQLVGGGPYTREQLAKLKRPDLVMYAAQLEIKTTSRPQERLIAAVMAAQLARQAR